MDKRYAVHLLKLIKLVFIIWTALFNFVLLLNFDSIRYFLDSIANYCTVMYRFNNLKNIHFHEKL